MVKFPRAICSLQACTNLVATVKNVVTTPTSCQTPSLCYARHWQSSILMEDAIAN